MDTTQVIKQYYGKSIPDLSYATVGDFCDSADHLAGIMRFDGDMKDVQRTWAVKAVLGKLPRGSKLLEIGAGEPIVADALRQLGYPVTIMDPYDGSGNGPRTYQVYVEKYPKVKIIKALFQDNNPMLAEKSFDGIYSVSVLEHVPNPQLDQLFDGIKKYLRLGGFSIHCIDHVLSGPTADGHDAHFRRVLLRHAELQEPQPDEAALQRQIQEYYQKMSSDVETYYHSAQGHNLWRGGRPYAEVPFRRIISTQAVAEKRF